MLVVSWPEYNWSQTLLLVRNYSYTHVHVHVHVYYTCTAHDAHFQYGNVVQWLSV